MEVIILLAVSIIIYYAMRCYKLYNYRKHQIMLTRVKDKLICYSKEGKINEQTWLFEYLNTSISKSLITFSHFNIWYAIFLRKNHKNDHELSMFKLHLEHSLLEDEYCNEVYQEYLTVLCLYVVKRHVVLLFLAKVGFDYTTESIRFCNQLWQGIKKSLKSLAILPELTTSNDYSKSKNKQFQLSLLQYNNNHYFH